MWLWIPVLLFVAGAAVSGTEAPKAAPGLWKSDDGQGNLPQKLGATQD